MSEVAAGDLIRGKYALTYTVGSGAYSNVYKCVDATDEKEKAIKVIADRYAWEVEVSFLRKLGEGSSEDTKFLMRHLEDFRWKKNYFIVMPLHKMSLFDFWDSDEAVFPVRHVKDIAFQLLSAVAYLHSLEIVHTDIKMENILVENADDIDRTTFCGEPKKMLRDTKIVLCDFDKARILKRGETVNDGQLVQTQCVRAPEVILGLPWNELIDEWSVGVVLIELLVHKQIFGVEEAVFDQPTEKERLQLMEEIWKQTDYTPISMLRESRFKIFRRLHSIPINELPPLWKMGDPNKGIPFNPELIVLCNSLLSMYPPCRLSAGAAVHLQCLDGSRSRLEEPNLV